MQRLLILILFSALSFNSWSRCHSGYADGILKKALDCNGENISINNIDGASGAANEVVRVCMGGCYSALFNPDLREECDKKYAKALLASESAINDFATKKKCKYSPKKIKDIANASSSPNDPFASCFWVSNNIVSPKNSTCGRTPACVGIGYCLEGEYSGGQLMLQCETSKGGECPSFEVCASADNPSWLSLDKAVGPCS